MINIAILALPRTGSNYLAECMTQTGAFGHVDGFFVGTGDLLATQFEQNAQEWLTTHRKGDIHACKLSLDYFDHVSQYVTLDRIQAIIETFTHFVVLDRVDRAAQAVSYFVAKGTKQWTSVTPIRDQVPEYNFWRIHWYYSFLQGMADRFETYAYYSHKPAMTIYYDEVAINVSDVIQMIAQFTGVTLGEYALKPTLQRQTMPEKDAYLARFRKELEKELEYVG